MSTLHERHARQLAGSAISDDIIAARGYRTIAPGAVLEWRTCAGAIHKDELLRRVLHEGALAFPLYQLAQPEPFTWVLRPDIPRRGKDGKPIKYEYPPRVKNIFDVLPRYRGALTNPEIPLWLTEGAKKADALASAFGDKIVPVNENGVWGWRSKGRMVEDVSRVVWEGRRVVIAPDGDVRHNKMVYQAVQRSAKVLLAMGAAEVLICLLPQEKDGPKIGVDDYLAAGHTPEQVESHLVELGTVAREARVSLMKHPKTGIPLYLPPGFDIQDKVIVRRDPTGVQPFYSGLIIVTGTGCDLHSGDETATVMWRQNGHYKEIAVPRQQLASTRGCSEVLGRAGAAVHANNSRYMSQYLQEFITENYEQLPRVNYVDRLGGAGDGGLVLPAGAVGMEGETKYTGPEVRVGTDFDSYPRALRQIVSDPARSGEAWNNTSVLWAALALGMAGPAIARIRPGRNPVLILAGSSGSGKSTLINFTTGTYGDPTRSPLRVQCGSATTTPKGVQQTLTVTNGVPLHLEDVHMMHERHPTFLSGTIYDFANGQLRTFGTLDQRGGGGQEIGGTLLMSGELIPDFQHAGAQKRVLLFNCMQSPPLGVAPESPEGARRAAALDSAWAAGAGTFGLQVSQAIWRDWPAFLRDVRRLELDESIRDLQAWRVILATAAAVLRVAFQQVGIHQLVAAELMREWAALYRAGQRERNPASETFEKVLTMLSQAEVADDGDLEPESRQRIAPTWRWLHYDRKMIAAYRIGDPYWRVLTTSPQWLAQIGPGAVDMFGSAWLEAGHITAHAGKRPVSAKAYMGPGKASLQCILVPLEHFDDRAHM